MQVKDLGVVTWCVALGLGCAGGPAAAGDRLGWTGAVTQVEGSAGGGVVPWALIGGLGTEDQGGATAFATYVSTQDFSLRAGGASVAYGNRVELSVARQRFDAGSVVPGLTLGQDIVGLKVRVLGDAVFAPDEYLPQIAVGAQWKRTLDFEQIPRAVGAARGEDVDVYVAATKLYFAALAGHNVIIDATVRRTRANQFGLLGFGAAGRGAAGRGAAGRGAAGAGAAGGGGDAGGFRWMPEVSAALWLDDALLLGVEYRDKPNNLAAFRESSAKDVFVAWGPVKNLSLTAAYADLGDIAGKTAQRGVYVAIWVGI